MSVWSTIRSASRISSKDPRVLNSYVHARVEFGYTRHSEGMK